MSECSFNGGCFYKRAGRCESPGVCEFLSRSASEEIERLRREADAATGIPARLLSGEPPVHPTATELMRGAR